MFTGMFSLYYYYRRRRLMNGTSWSRGMPMSSKMRAYGV
jgi:hypothetical protein